MLPFANLSDDATNEHFADGLAEELLNVLAKIPGLRVASRTSAFSFKGNKEIDIPTVARKLNVATVLEGSVRRAGQRVRITAQLVQAASDSHLWSQAYDRELDDIFAVQDDIARSVVQELRSALLGEQADAAASARVREQVRAATRGRTLNAQAHELYLLGRFLVDRMNPDDTTTAIGYYRQALQLDPRYALAWAGLAGAYSNQADYSWAPMAQTFELARAAALHAIELEPELAEGHTELAWVQMCHEWDWHGAAASSARALELGASDRSAVIAASVLADSLGRKEESVALARRAAALDPLSYIAHGNLALRCLNSDLLEEADAALDQAFKLNPRAGLLPAVLGTLRLEQGRLDEALAAFQQEGIEALRLSGIAMAQHGRGQHAESEATLKQADRTMRQRRRPADCRSVCLPATTPIAPSSGWNALTSSATPVCRRCNRGRCCATCTAIRAGGPFSRRWDLPSVARSLRESAQSSARTLTGRAQAPRLRFH